MNFICDITMLLQMILNHTSVWLWIVRRVVWRHSHRREVMQRRTLRYMSWNWLFQHRICHLFSFYLHFWLFPRKPVAKPTFPVPRNNLIILLRILKVYGFLSGEAHGRPAGSLPMRRCYMSLEIPESFLFFFVVLILSSWGLLLLVMIVRLV